MVQNIAQIFSSIFKTQIETTKTIHHQICQSISESGPWTQSLKTLIHLNTTENFLCLRRKRIISVNRICLRSSFYQRPSNVFSQLLLKRKIFF